MYKKILFSVLISFLLIKSFSSFVFLSNTPRFNPKFIAFLKDFPSNAINTPKNILAGIQNIFLFQKNNNDFNQNQNQNFNNQIANQNISLITPPPNLEFKPVSKYVEAAEDEKTGKTYMKIKKGTKIKVVGTIEINGKTYPKVEIIEE